MKFQIFRTRALQWRWRLRAANNKIIANSGEAYWNKKDCLACVALVQSVDNATPIEDKSSK